MNILVFFVKIAKIKKDYKKLLERGAVRLKKILTKSIVLTVAIMLCVFFIAPSIIHADPNNPDVNGGSANLTQWEISNVVGVFGNTNSGFVALFYNRLLNRVPDKEGGHIWVTRLASGGLTDAGLVKQLIFSVECQNIISNYTNEQFITFLYQTLLNREPDPDGLNTWLTRMSAGMTKERVVNAFTDSVEFKNICGLFGLKTNEASYSLPFSGSPDVIAGNGDGYHVSMQAYAWDFGMPVGTPVLASRGGNVLDLLEGDYIVIDQLDGTYALYLRLSKVYVSIGDNISQGQEIGLSGQAGSEQHLHFQVQRTVGWLGKKNGPLSEDDVNLNQSIPISFSY